MTEFAEFKRVLDPIFVQPNNYTLVAEAGAMSSTIYSYNCARPSAGNVVINCPPPGPKQVMSRKIDWFNAQDYIFTGENTSSQPFPIPGTWAPQPLMMQRAGINTQMNVNSMPVEVSLTKDFYPYLYEADNEEVTKNCEWSLSCSQAANTTTCIPYPDCMFSLRNPNSTSFDNTSIGVPNGAFPGFEVNYTTPTSAAVKYSFYEALILSPFQAGGGSFEASTLSGIDTLQFNANFQNLHKGFLLNWQNDPVDGLPRIDFDDGTYQKITSIQLVEDTMVSTIRIKWYTMLPDVRLQPTIRLPQFTWTKNVQTYTVNLAPGDTTTITYSNLETIGIPEDFWIFFPTVSLQDRDSSSIVTCTKPFAVLALGNFPIDPTRVIITLTHTTTSQMQSYNLNDVYQEEVNLGYNKSFSEFVGLIGGTDGGGSPLRLRPGKTFQMEDGTAPGCSGKNTWALQVTIRNNIASEIVSQDFVVFTRNIGYVQLGDGGEMANDKRLNLFTPDKVMATQISETMSSGSGDIEWAAGGKFADFFTKTIPRGISSLWRSKLVGKGLTALSAQYPQLAPAAAAVTALGGARAGGLEPNYQVQAGARFVPANYGMRGGFVQNAQQY